jgi:hypothetical protein
MDDDFRDRARLRRRQMEKRLEILVTSCSLSASNGGNVQLTPMDREPDLSGVNEDLFECLFNVFLYQGNTLLHYCGWVSEAGEAARKLLEVISVTARNKHGETAFHVACRAGNAAVLAELLKGLLFCFVL